MDPVRQEGFESVKGKLLKSRRPVIVCGTDVVRETTPGLAADLGLLLRAEKERVGLFYLMPGANAFGAAMLSSGRSSVVDTIDSIEKGFVKAVVLVECDPFRLFPDRERLRNALRQLDLLIVMDYLPSEAVRDAGIFLPTRTLFEAETIFVNQEGRAQFSPQAHRGGIPIEQISGGGHPPREFRSDIPGNQPRAAWQVLLQLGDLLSLPGDWKATSREDLLKKMGEEDPLFADLQEAGVSSPGVRLLPSQGKGTAFSSAPGYGEKNSAPVRSLEVLFADRTFGTEELSCYSPYIEQAESPPSLLMHPADAKEAA
jgi:NADH-quinone oxidoreductase subunit G